MENKSNQSNQESKNEENIGWLGRFCWFKYFVRNLLKNCTYVHVRTHISPRMHYVHGVVGFRHVVLLYYIEEYSQFLNNKSDELLLVLVVVILISLLKNRCV